MPDFLLVTAQDPVNLNATIDGSGALQISHSSDCLVDYSQTLHAAHDDLNQPTGLVMIKIFDFSSGGATWQMSAVHGSTNWSRGTDYAYFEFGPMSSPLTINITATAPGVPAKTRQISIKTKPTNGQPDEPRPR
jgi:hypothetical protein